MSFMYTNTDHVSYVNSGTHNITQPVFGEATKPQALVVSMDPAKDLMPGGFAGILWSATLLEVLH